MISKIFKWLGVVGLCIITALVIYGVMADCGYSVLFDQCVSGG